MWRYLKINLTIFIIILLAPMFLIYPPDLYGEEELFKMKSIAMGVFDKDEASEKNKPQVAEPTLMIRLDDAHFDPLYKMPAQKSGLPTIESYPDEVTGYYIVQFDGPIQKRWKDTLRQEGVEIFEYMPDFAFIVRMPSVKEATVKALSHVRWVGIFQPSYRISTSAMSKMYSEGGKSEAAPVSMRVNVFPGADLGSIKEHIESLGGVVREQYSTTRKTTLGIDIPADRIADLAGIEGVKWIEPKPEWKLFNDVSTDIINVRTPRDNYGLYGEGQTVGVCDTGLDQGSTDPASLHDDFEDGAGSSRVLQIIDRVAAYETGVDESDVDGHGTHVAGSVLGNGLMSGSDPTADDFPPTCIAGMAPKANLIFQAVENNDTGYLEGLPTDLNELFSEADDAGADLHTNSWGGSAAGAYDSYSKDVDEYMWDHKDFLILFSAGNEGADLDADGIIDLYTTGIPGTAKNCLTIGASEGDRPSDAAYDFDWGTFHPWAYSVDPIYSDHVSDSPEGMAAFSSRGPTLDGRIKPDLVAPGTNILSTRSSLGGDGWGAYNSYYMWSGGTSMATPLSAGAAALMREYLIGYEGFTNPSAALIKAALINSAEDISPGQYGIDDDQEIPDAPVPNNVAGWGRLNLGNGIYPTAPASIFYYDENAGLETGESLDYPIEVTDAGIPLKINLVWTDAPGTESAQGGLVNDLDLLLTDPSGTEHYPDHASQQQKMSTISYDDDSPGTALTNSYAVRFTPDSYPVYVDSTTFMYGNDGVNEGVDVAVYGDNGSGLPDIATELFRKSLSFVPLDYTYLTIPINLTISSGDFHIAIEKSATLSLRMPIEIDGNPEGRTSQRNGGASGDWHLSNVTALIRANVLYSDNYSTSFDRVNNILGVTIDTPDPGLYSINVTGYNIAEGPQPHALVISGAITLPIYTVIFASNANGSISGVTTQGVQHGNDCSPVTAVPDQGYEFNGWSGDYTGTDNPLTITNVASDMTITANFQFITHTVTFQAGTGGSITGDLAQEVLDGGDCAPVTAVPDQGYEFDGWSGDYTGTDNPLTITNVASDMNITANFTASSGDSGDGGGICFISSVIE